MTTRALIRAAKHHWATRPRINLSPPLIPTWLLTALFGFAAVMTAHLAWRLGKVVPAYFEAAAEVEQWDLVGIALGLVIFVMAAVAWAFGAIASIYGTELRKRLLGY
jgi:hypothetical protein